jgi:erythromycin esterase-like protein
VSQLVELRRSASIYATRDGSIAADDLFFAEQNAQVVRNAERYYRAMFGSHIDSWNLRDRHMVETLDTLLAFLQRQRPSAKVVVWAHNSHLGDARATEMSSSGELNVGQLVRERYQKQAFLVGFTTYRGTVTAAADWGGAAERKAVRAALPDSYEALFHESGAGNFLIDLRTLHSSPLNESRLERAIGVVYRPETERQSHYFRAWLRGQFDAVLHYDTTRAVEPLERTTLWDRREVPETYPTAL